MTPLTSIVMTKLPRPGHVKTRLVGDGLVPEVAAEIAFAMLRCVVARLQARGPVVLAITPDGGGEALVSRLGLGPLDVIDQGSGLLGERMQRVWSTRPADQPVAFFGMDSPDIPDDALASIPVALDAADLAIGPTLDGGYWTLAARRFQPDVLEGIAWGGAEVYAQTLSRARVAGLSVDELSGWFDVDTLSDLEACRERLQSTEGEVDPDSPLAMLAVRLTALLPDQEFPAPSAV